METKTKKILSKITLGSIVLGSIFSSTTLADDYAYVKVVHLNIRAAWIHTAKIIATVDKWYKVTILETLDNGWEKVLLENGETGYLNGKYVTDIEPQYEKVSWSKYTIKSWRAFLRWFNMTSKVAVLEKWDTLEVTSDKLYLSKWIQVRVSDSKTAKYIWRTWYVAKALVQVIDGYEFAPEQIDTSVNPVDTSVLDNPPPFELNSAPADESASTDNSTDSTATTDVSSTDESASADTGTTETTDSGSSVDDILKSLWQ